MSLRNPFSDETRELFFNNYECWWCGENSVDCLHHILGRESSSPLNAAPLCNFKCHIGNEGRLQQEASFLLLKTYHYLMDQGYILEDKDREFIEKHKKLYKWLK